MGLCRRMIRVISWTWGKDYGDMRWQNVTWIPREMVLMSTSYCKQSCLPDCKMLCSGTASKNILWTVALEDTVSYSAANTRFLHLWGAWRLCLLLRQSFAGQVYLHTLLKLCHSKSSQLLAELPWEKSMPAAPFLVSWGGWGTRETTVTRRHVFRGLWPGGPCLLQSLERLVSLKAQWVRKPLIFPVSGPSGLSFLPSLISSSQSQDRGPLSFFSTWGSPFLWDILVSEEAWVYHESQRLSSKRCIFGGVTKGSKKFLPSVVDELRKVWAMTRCRVGAASFLCTGQLENWS